MHQELDGAQLLYGLRPARRWPAALDGHHSTQDKGVHSRLVSGTGKAAPKQLHRPLANVAAGLRGVGVEMPGPVVERGGVESRQKSGLAAARRAPERDSRHEVPAGRAVVEEGLIVVI